MFNRRSTPEKCLARGIRWWSILPRKGFVDGKIIPSKVGLDSNGCLKGACIPYGGTENRIDSFDELTSEWNTSYVRCRTGDQPPEKAVIGGHDEGPSYHARAKIYNGKKFPEKSG